MLKRQVCVEVSPDASHIGHHTHIIPVGRTFPDIGIGRSLEIGGIKQQGGQRPGLRRLAHDDGVEVNAASRRNQDTVADQVEAVRTRLCLPGGHQVQQEEHAG
jgi:hypothetical protein